MADRDLMQQINNSTGVNRSKSYSSLEEFLDKRTDYKTKLNNRNYDFAMQVDQIVLNTEARMLAVMRDSIQNVVEDAQTTVANGGKMRVDTGFLRSSGVAALNAAPRGPSSGDPKGKYAWVGDTITTILANMKFGDAFYFGWTAHYAKYREAHDGFLESALQKWQTHVDKATQVFKNKDMRK